MDRHQIILNRRDRFDAELRELQMEALDYQHTYFEPTSNTRLQYDCVIYKMQVMNATRANDKTYLNRPGFDVTVISRDPETPLPWMIQERFPRCSPGKAFMNDNLYHFPFTIFY